MNRYPAYKPSGVDWLGEIPVHWDVWKLSHAFKKIGSGTTPNTNVMDYYDGEIPWVTTSELRENLINDTTKKVTEKALKDHSALFVYPKGTLLIAMYGATVGRLGILGLPASMNQACCALAESKTIDTYFLYYWLLARRNEIIALSSGGGQPNISQEKIRSLKVSTPPIEEQQAIVAFLDGQTAVLDALIAEKQALIGLLQEKRAAVIGTAVTQGLDPTVPMKESGVEWIGQIPAHWEVRRLKLITSFITSGSRGWAQYYADEGAFFIRIGNLSNYSPNLKLSDIQYVQPPLGTEGERTRVQENDLLVSITANIGSIGVVPKQFGEAYVNQHVALTRPKLNLNNSRWLAYCLLSRIGQEQFSSLLYGGTKDGLSLGDVSNLTLLIPPIKEQHVIVRHLDQKQNEFDELIAETEASIAALQEYRAALIATAVTGQIDVRHAAI